MQTRARKTQSSILRSFNSSLDSFQQMEIKTDVEQINNSDNHAPNGCTICFLVERTNKGENKNFKTTNKHTKEQKIAAKTITIHKKKETGREDKKKLERKSIGASFVCSRSVVFDIHKLTYTVTMPEDKKIFRIFCRHEILCIRLCFCLHSAYEKINAHGMIMPVFVRILFVVFF